MESEINYPLSKIYATLQCQDIKRKSGTCLYLNSVVFHSLLPSLTGVIANRTTLKFNAPCICFIVCI